MSEIATPEKLIEDLRKARQAAAEACVGVKDGGSMSMDMVFLPVGKTAPIKRKGLTWDRAIEQAGLSSFRVNTAWWKGYLIYPDTVGQASVRLQACETMAKSLKDWNAYVYYQMD